MRKFEIALLAAALCLTLTACGGSPSKQEPAPQPTQPQKDSVITIERINEAFVANNEHRPPTTMIRPRTAKSYNEYEQVELAKKNYASKQWACLLGSEIKATPVEETPRLHSGSDIQYTAEEMETGGFLVSGTMIPNYFESGVDTIIIGKADKPVEFSFKYNPDKNEVWDMLFTAPEPLVFIPQIDLSFPDTTEDFKRMLSEHFVGGPQPLDGSDFKQYKAQDVANVEVLHAEMTDDPQYSLLDSKHYHVLISLSDGRKVYTEFEVYTNYAEARIGEIGSGIIVE